MKHGRAPLIVLIAACAWMVSGVTHAQTYPTKPVRMIVPFPPGGATDLLARVVAQKLGESLGHQVVVDNRPGAGGTIGSRLMLDAQPDGYTILTSSVSTHAIGPHLYAKPPYDPLKDFTAITELSFTPTVLMASGTLPVNSLKDLIALAKAKPGQLNYGSSGVGTQFHLSGELLKLLAGIDMVHIPYKGTALVYPDLFSGQVAMMFDTLSVAIPFIKAGRVKALGVTGNKRTPTLPDVPTIAEAGVPGFSADLWLGIWGPAKLPRDITERLSSEVAKLLKQPDVRERLAGQGMEPVGSTPAQFAEFVRRENEQWSKVVKSAGVKAE
jgi:tripartite-type tricarboxylate transporter receptor subunit TctC